MKAKSGVGMTNLNVRVPIELKDQFFKVLEEDDRSASQVMRRLIRDYIREQEHLHGYREHWGDK